MLENENISSEKSAESAVENSAGITAIRKVTMEDADAVYILMQELGSARFDREALKDILKEQLEQPEMYICFVCEEAGKGVIGVVNMRMENQLHHGARVAEVMELVVLETEQGRGIGTRLLHHAETYAAEHGCVELELSSHFIRREAHAFYEHYGMNKDHYNFTKEL